MAEGGMILIGGLWKGKTRDDRPILSGKVGNNFKIVILPNKNKQPGDKRPDCNMFIAAVEREQNSGGDSDDNMI